MTFLFFFRLPSHPAWSSRSKQQAKLVIHPQSKYLPFSFLCFFFWDAVESWWSMCSIWQKQQRLFKHGAESPLNLMLNNDNKANVMSTQPAWRRLACFDPSLEIVDFRQNSAQLAVYTANGYTSAWFGSAQPKVPMEKLYLSAHYLQCRQHMAASLYYG